MAKHTGTSKDKDSGGGSARLKGTARRQEVEGQWGNIGEDTGVLHDLVTLTEDKSESIYPCSAKEEARSGISMVYPRPYSRGEGQFY